ncbi:MAG: AI-2E family transporter [Rhodoplanes sp.]|uniref:AI-2E family transporter n=1 Tax=Rhodoplanes sp. TaxID=1968906 RepID=UPI00185A4767|nr:AI-2E family transporter [Rhodoplanes sp.]NVO16644.1 AI-2E family transporter [Rhodoplanes sp.]
MTTPKDPSPEPVAVKLASTTTLIERGTALAAFVALMIGVALIVKPFVTGILFGGILAIATWPMRDALVRRGVSGGVAATILLMAAVATIGVPAVSLAPGLAERLVKGAQQIQAYFAGMPELPTWLANIPFVEEPLRRLWADLADPSSIVQEVFKSYSAELQRALVEIAKAFADGIFQLLVSLAVAFGFWLRGDTIARTLREIAERLGGATAGTALESAADSVRGVAYGIVGTAAVQAVLMAIGLLMAGVPGAGLLGFLALLIALSQFGILLAFIWGGAAWWLFGLGSTGWAIFIIAWGIMVSTVDNFIRPWLVSFGAALPFTLIFLGVLGGFLAFGFLGLFIGPTLLGVFINMLDAWRRASAPPVVALVTPPAVKG